MSVITPALPQSHRVATPRPAEPQINLSETERWISALVGGVLGVYALRHPRSPSLAPALAATALLYRASTGYCRLYAALGIDASGRSHGPRASVRAAQGVKVVKSITIARSPEELFRRWRNLESLPRFMTHLESVRVLDATRSHWVARGPLGSRAEWDAEIHHEEPDRMIAWRSLPGSQVDTAGSIHFDRAAADRGTTVRVSLKYDPPAGQIGALAARLLGESPDAQVQEELRRFKRLMEAGEIATTHGQTSCRATRS